MKNLSFLPSALAVLFAMVIIGSCTKGSSNNPMPTPMGHTLYDSLGGTALVADPTHPGAMIEKGRLGIRNVIDSTIFVIAADARINGHFTILLSEVTKGNLSGFTDLSENLTTFVSGVTGAKDFIYIGLNMHDAHDPAVNSRINGKATSADFDAFVDDLVKGANKNKLPANLLNSIGKIVQTLRSQVVQM
jgi:hypothetical protein